MTKLSYLDDTELHESESMIVSIETPPGSAGPVVVLEETIFYPQGGGQPTDVGVISCGESEFLVSRVSFSDGTVYHSGKFTTGELSPGDHVHLAVDGERRMRHAKLHTGGHLVMTAVDRLLQLPAVKGYHFPDGPYVEFEGAIDADRRERTIIELQEALDQLISDNSGVTSQYVGVEELRARGIHIPAEIPAGKPTRIVVTSGYVSPCGGTHVKRLGELSGLKIKGLKTKSGHTRISYFIEGL